MENNEFFKPRTYLGVKIYYDEQTIEQKNGIKSVEATLHKHWCIDEYRHLGRPDNPVRYKQTVRFWTLAKAKAYIKRINDSCAVTWK